MKFQIKSWSNGSILFEGEFGSLKLCVEAAIGSRANLSRADLRDANLSDANLSGAYLSRANLSRANLSRANLSGADLRDANLSGAYLSRADLSRANLSRANLSRADLSRANLSRANLKDIKNAELALARTRIAPQEGAFVGWKKLRHGEIARLVIPHDSARVNAAGSRKCRASKVFVHAIWDANGNEVSGPLPGLHDAKTLYEVGKETVPDSFDDSITEECSHGIHFYMTKEEAQAH